MESKDVNTDSLDNSCPLCLDLLFQPVTLDCKHSFCHFCLYQLLHLNSERQEILTGRKQEYQSLDCPICRANQDLSKEKLKINESLEDEILKANFDHYQKRSIEVAKDLELFKKLKFHHGKIILGNHHELVGRDDSDNVHKWTLFVRQDGFTEKIIKSVIVKLHPTFTPSQITLSHSPFEMTRLGWGVFLINLEIHFKIETNLKPLKVQHCLSFEGDGDFNEIEIDYKTSN